MNSHPDRLVVWIVFVCICKVLYDAFRNEQQKALYLGDETDGPVKSIWQQVGDDSWFEARRAKYEDSSIFLFRAFIFFLGC